MMPCLTAWSSTSDTRPLTTAAPRSRDTRGGTMPGWNFADTWETIATDPLPAAKAGPGFDRLGLLPGKLLASYQADAINEQGR